MAHGFHTNFGLRDHGATLLRIHIGPVGRRKVAAIRNDAAALGYVVLV